MRIRFSNSVVLPAATGVVFAVAVSLWAQAPAGLTPAQATAPAGGSQNADTAKAAAKGGGRGTRTRRARRPDPQDA